MTPHDIISLGGLLVMFALVLLLTAAGRLSGTEMQYACWTLITLERLLTRNRPKE